MQMNLKDNYNINQIKFHECTNLQRYTHEEIQDLINQTAQIANILPITSRCDAACIFCSHQNNPKHIHTLYVGERTLEDVIHTMAFLNGHQPITIGESASNIIEGEPTSHKNFREIIQALRCHFPYTQIIITTNGHHLTEDLIQFISEHQPIFIQLSLNSASLKNHMTLMGDTSRMAQCSIDSVVLMHKYHVPFSCSMVGMPNITGFDDIRQTIDYMAFHGAKSIQIFMPGFSSFVRSNIFPNPDTIYQNLKAFVDNLPDTLPCPVLLEPSYVKDLKCIVSGCSAGSPAYDAGIRKGDQILSVNGQTPACRTEAFKMLEGYGHKDIIYYSAQNHESEAICRPLRKTGWTNTEQGCSGISMAYDFDPERAKYMHRTILSAPGKVLSLSSEFAAPLIRTIIEQMHLPTNKCDVHTVKNITFGGTIRAAGLLCFIDYITAYKVYISGHTAPNALILPCESFNYHGRDLSGHHYREIESALGIPVTLV